MKTALDPHDDTMPVRRLREPIVMHLVVQQDRTHRRPLEVPLVAATVRRLIDSEGTAT